MCLWKFPNEVFTMPYINWNIKQSVIKDDLLIVILKVYFYLLNKRMELLISVFPKYNSILNDIHRFLLTVVATGHCFKMLAENFGTILKNPSQLLNIPIPIWMHFPLRRSFLGTPSGCHFIWHQTWSLIW